MTHYPKVLIPLIFLALLSGHAISCSSSKKETVPTETQVSEITFHNGLHAVPKDTIYAFSSFGQLPKEIGHAIYTSAALYQSLECQLEKTTQRFQLSGREASIYIQNLGQVIARDSGLEDPNQEIPDWSSKLGLSPTPELVVYSVGANPVARLTLEDPKRFSQILEEVDKKVGFEVQKVAFKGVTARLLNQNRSGNEKPDGPKLLIAVVNQELVVAQILKNALKNENLLPLLLGWNVEGMNINELPFSQMINDVNLLGGYVAYGKFFSQILHKPSTPSGSILHEYVNQYVFEGQKDNCTSALSNYKYNEKEELKLLSYIDTQKEQVKFHVTLDIDKKTSEDLTKSIRPSVTVEEELESKIDETSKIRAKLNANLFELGMAVSQAIDDEVDVFAQCSGKFNYQPGALKLLLTPMQSFLSLVDSVSGSITNLSRNRDGLLVVHSSNPEALFGGLVSLLGINLDDTEVTVNEVKRFDEVSSFSIPFNYPIHALVTEKDVNLTFGTTYDYYLNHRAKEQPHGNQQSKGSLAEIAIANQTENLSTSKRAGNLSTVKLEVNHEQKLLVDGNSFVPLKEYFNDNNIKKWYNNRNNRCY